MSDVAIEQQGLDEFFDFCNNTMPARIAGYEETSRADASEPSRINLRLHGLLERDPNAAQWAAAHAIARRFGLHPGHTRWERTTTEARGRHAGIMIFERWYVRSN